MQLSHRFSVPAPLDQAWRAFSSLERLAPCFPGARITEVDGDAYRGSVKIKFGPLPLVYAGTASFVERDETARRMVVEAGGTDRRGHGAFAATVTADFTENGSATDVAVTTDLTLTGRVAQFGHGVLDEVSDRLLEQFLTCLRPRFAEGLGAAEPESEPALEAERAVAEPVSAEATEAPHADTTQSPASADAESPTPARPVEAPPAPPSRSAVPPPRNAYTPPSNLSQPHFQVLSSVAPPLLRRYGPAVGGVLVVVVVVVRIVGRRRTRRRS